MASTDLCAVLLVAGEGRRLTSGGLRLPQKCLLDLGGRTLLERHVTALAECGVGALHLVTGFQGDVVWSSLLGATADAPIAELERLDNPDFRSGSIVSLARAGGVLGHRPCLVMDGDVLYPPELLLRLVDSPHEDCVLLDRQAGRDDEEMRFGADEQGRVHALRRGLAVGWPVIGESVGFYKLGSAAGRLLANALARRLAAGRLTDDYEQAIDDVLSSRAARYELVEPSPWIEIDFPEDLERARQEVLPLL